MRISDWSSDVCSSDLSRAGFASFVATSPESRRCRMDGRRKSLLGRAIALARQQSREVEDNTKSVLTGQVVAYKQDKTTVVSVEIKGKQQSYVNAYRSQKQSNAPTNSVRRRAV